MDQNTQPQATPPANTQPTPPANDTLDLSDIFPKDTPPAQPTPPAPVTPPVNTPPADDDEAKKFAEVNQKVDQFGNKIDEIDQNVDRKIARTQEIATFFQDAKNKPFQKYQAEIIRVAQDRKYSGYKLDRIIPFALGADKMLQIGAEMAKIANDTANANRTGGNSNNGSVQNTGKSKDWWAMSGDDFAKHTQNVLMGGR